MNKYWDEIFKLLYTHMRTNDIEDFILFVKHNENKRKELIKILQNMDN